MVTEKDGKVKKYVIPKWCGMPKGYHEDGMGGCWSISGGMVTDEDYCRTCEFKNVKP